MHERKDHVVYQKQLHNNRRATEQEHVHVADFGQKIEKTIALGRDLDDCNQRAYRNADQKAENRDIRRVAKAFKHFFVAFVDDERAKERLPL